MNKRVLTFGIFLVISLSVFSQSKNYIDGYVIKVSGDTIYGQLKELKEAISCSKFVFLDPGGNKIKFKQKNVLAYKRGDDLYVKKKYERPVQIGPMTGYMKLLVDGPMKLYKFECYENSGGTYSTHYIDYYLERNGKHVLIREFGFKNTAAKYFSDNIGLVNSIKSGNIKHKDLEQIVKRYNQDIKEK